MRKRFLISLSFLLALGLGLGGCGSGGGGSGNARPAAEAFVLPFLPTSPFEAFALGLKNLASQSAPVFVSAYDPAGGMYGAANQLFVVPAHGELQVPLGSIAGGPTNGGSLRIETRDVNDRDAVTGIPNALPTSGLVLPYVMRSLGGGSPDEDASPAQPLFASGVDVTLTPYTSDVQVVNRSFDENAPLPTPVGVTLRTTEYDANGDMVGAPVDRNVPADGTLQVPFASQGGRITIEPQGAVPAGRHVQYAAASRENGLQVYVDSRFIEAPRSSLQDLGFEMAFGQDTAGNVHDFGLLMTNPTGSTETVVLQGIYRKGGQPILTTPRAFALDGGRTVLMKTTTQDSIGLRQGEVSFFDDLFGDVFQAQGFDEFTLFVQAPKTLGISARHHDPAFGSFYEVLRGVARTTRACIYGFPIETTTAGGRRNYVSITNTTNGSLEIPIRAFTPMQGTEYILDRVTVPPLSRLDWSPDGMILREEPTDTVGAPVPFLQLEMTPLTGAFFRSRTEARDANELLIFVTPTIVRD